MMNNSGRRLNRVLLGQFSCGLFRLSKVSVACSIYIGSHEGKNFNPFMISKTSPKN